MKFKLIFAMINRKIALVLAVCSLLGRGNGFATTFLQFDSSYLGDGWFQYRMQVMNDPFFTRVTIPQLFFNFTNQIDHSTSSQHWTNSDASTAEGSFSDWYSDSTNPTRPYQDIFLMRSSETNYRVADFSTANCSAVAILGLSYADYHPASSYWGNHVSVGGYARLPGIVPCRPEDADGSPTNYSFTLKLVPDITIQQLIQSNGVVHGVDFLWGNESTLLLQASTDMQSWTNVAYLWSYPPETVWTTNTPLNSFGQFFRVALVANGHGTNMPPLNSLAVQTKASLAKSTAVTVAVPRVSGCQMIQGKIAVNITTEQNKKYTVNVLDSNQTIQATQTLTATGASETVYFAPKDLPSPVYFEVSTASTP